MKTRSLTLLCALMLPLSAKADWVIVQNVENSSPMMHQPSQITLKIKGNKTRINNDTSASVITDGDSGNQITLIHAQKQYMIRSASQIKEATEMTKHYLASQADNETESTPKLQPTGKRENIGGYDAEEFVWEGKTAKGRCWIARDFPNYAALWKAMESSFGDARKLSGFSLPDFSSLPGFVVRSEQVYTITTKAPPGLTPAQARQAGFGQSQTVTNAMTLVSAKEETLSDSEFTVPADYKELGTNLPPSANSSAGLRDVLKAMEKEGLSEAGRKRFEQMIKDAEAKPAKGRK